MKTLYLFPILLLSLLSASCWGVGWDDLVERDGIYYKKFTESPFTGEVIGKAQGKMKDGIREGAWTMYYDNGMLAFKGSYKNGELEGAYVAYHENTKLWLKGSFNNGKKEGEWVRYHENGQLRQKGSYKNGEKEGKWVRYHKDGTVNEYGTGTFKNDEKISD